MNRLINKPHLFFFGLTPIVLILGYFLKNKSYNIVYYGAIFPINYFDFFLISTIFFSLIGINYFSLSLVKRKPKKGLTIAHLVFQSIALILLVYYILQTGNTTNTSNESVLNLTLLSSFFTFLISLIIHLAIFFMSMLLGKDTANESSS